jgi:hypothetical protein
MAVGSQSLPDKLEFVCRRSEVKQTLKTCAMSTSNSTVSTLIRDSSKPYTGFVPYNAFEQFPK